MFNTLINIFANIFDWASSGHVILSNEQIFKICRNIIGWGQVFFYFLLVFFYLLLTHKMCEFLGGWSRGINRTHIIICIIMLSIGLLLWKFFIHSSYSTIEENSTILAGKIAETIEYREGEGYVLNFIK